MTKYIGKIALEIQRDYWENCKKSLSTCSILSPHPACTLYWWL